MTRELRDADELEGAELVTAALAERVAMVCDAAYRADDPRMMLAASGRLEVLLGKLTTAGGGGEHGGNGDGDDDIGTLLEGAIRGAPTV